ncbi:MAG: efflux RND transporter periplasmic adaptor subunit [Burkholderiaceae bacterium]
MTRPFSKPWLLAQATSLALLALLAALLIDKVGAAEDKKVAPKPALTVTVVKPALGRLPVQLTANGSIAAWQEASIGTESSGLRLTEVKVNVGDVVRAGQVLAVFAADSVQADIAQARANLVEAQATASDAAGNAERARSLQDSGALSTQQINQYRTAAETATARVEAARALLAVQQLRLKHTQVLAPDNGVISARSATVGAVLASGTELFRMIRNGRLEWRAEVISSELGRLHPGTTALVTAASGAQLKGRVRMIAPTVDPQTRIGLVYVDLPTTRDMASPAKAGMFARGEFALGESSALMVPQTAVVLRDGFSYVYRLGSDNRVAQLKVQTGRRAGDAVEIVSALSADARLVASGGAFLSDGDLVRVVDDGKLLPAAAASAGAGTSGK